MPERDTPTPKGIPMMQNNCLSLDRLFPSISLAALLFLAGCTTEQPQQAQATPPSFDLVTGTWRFEMASPGGPLPFTVLIERGADGLSAAALNDNETLPFDQITVDARRVVLSIDHYESRFTGTLSQDGTRLEGSWTKLVDDSRTARLPFTANHGVASRFETNEAAATELAGKWAVQFTQDGAPSGEAIAEFRQDGNILAGTFLTPTGDYRYLEGVVDGHTMKLSCFDGGHAFLFQATQQADGSLQGDFWSSDKWHESWTAQRDDQASLPEATTQNHITNDDGIFRFQFPNLTGEMVSHDADFLQDKVRLITIFGSWCPNCNDEAPVLQKLKNEYGARGLEVVGLAFEATGDNQRDTRALKRFAKRHKLDYTLLLAGTKDKAEAGKMLPDLDKVLAYPTSLLLDRNGKVVRIHTGFNGPGTGAHHEKLVRDLRTEIEKLL